MITRMTVSYVRSQQNAISSSHPCLRRMLSSYPSRNSPLHSSHLSVLPLHPLCPTSATLRWVTRWEDEGSGSTENNEVSYVPSESVRAKDMTIRRRIPYLKGLHVLSSNHPWSDPISLRSVMEGGTYGPTTWAGWKGRR